MFAMVDYGREMTEKSWKYGEYGSFEYLLFLLNIHLNEIYTRK